MENEFYSYEIGDEQIELPRNWVDVEELREYAKEFGFQDSTNLERVLLESGVDVKDGKADFNQINLFILARGVISSEFLTKIMNSKYGEGEYFNVLELIDFLQSLNEFGPTEADVKNVVSALKRLAY